MSQSDYIRLKRVSQKLKDLNQTPNVPYQISPSEYVEYMNYQLSNTIVNTNINYNKLNPKNTITVFNIPVPNAIISGNYNTTPCQTYKVCRTGTGDTTTNRPNHITSWTTGNLSIPAQYTSAINNKRNIIPILPRKYVKHPAFRNLRNLDNNGNKIYHSTGTPYSTFNTNKIYHSPNTPNSTFNTNRSAYTNRRLKQMIYATCNETCAPGLTTGLTSETIICQKGSSD